MDSDGWEDVGYEMDTGWAGLAYGIEQGRDLPEHHWVRNSDIKDIPESVAEFGRAVGGHMGQVGDVWGLVVGKEEGTKGKQRGVGGGDATCPVDDAKNVSRQRGSHVVDQSRRR